jgi:hypothetical protein
MAKDGGMLPRKLQSFNYLHARLGYVQRLPDAYGRTVHGTAIQPKYILGSWVLGLGSWVLDRIG